MPDYLTITELNDRMGENLVQNLVKMSGAELTAELTATIDRQEGVIHGYIGGVYTTPLTGDAGMKQAEEWAFRLVQYDLHVRGYGDDVQKKVKNDWQETMRQLRDVGSGKFIISGETTSDTGSSFEMGSNSVQFDWEGDAENTF